MIVSDINRILLVGHFVTNWRRQETNSAVSYKALFAVERQSGFVDFLPIITFDDITILDVAGEYAKVIGRIITRNMTKDHHTSIITEVLCQTVTYTSALEPVNSVTMTGRVVGKAHFRKTPKGRLINNFAVAVRRRSGKTDLVHMIAWGGDAEDLANLSHGEFLWVSGRLQRREYVAKASGQKGFVYELSINNYVRREE